MNGPISKEERSVLGFTLIELLISLAILSFGMLGTAALTMGVIGGNFYSKNITSATVVAQTQIEAVQNRGYANANTSNFPSTPVTVNMGDVSFSRTTTIANNSPEANMKMVSVTVSWNEANNTARSVTLQTILAQ